MLTPERVVQLWHAHYFHDDTEGAISFARAIERECATPPAEAPAASAGQDAEAAFNEFADRYDHESNEWLDMDAQTTFIHGWQANAARQQSAEASSLSVLDELRMAICAIGVVGSIEGHNVIRRESVIDMIDRRRHSHQRASHAE